jgi:hypothetical protein
LKVGYGRTSTIEQQAGLDAQFRDLREAGCEKVFAEKASAVSKRVQLEAALDFIREGDTLLVTKLDRLRSVHPTSARNCRAREGKGCRPLHSEPRRHQHSDRSPNVYRHRCYRMLRARTDA